MSEIVQGFLACVSAALFFVCILAAVAPLFSLSGYGDEGDDGSGAPEGDLTNFRLQTPEDGLRLISRREPSALSRLIRCLTR